jgi:hypothetical protein
MSFHRLPVADGAETEQRRAFSGAELVLLAVLVL